MQITLLRKKEEQNTWDTLDSQTLLHDGALQVQLTLEALRKGKVHLFDPAALRRSKKIK